MWAASTFWPDPRHPNPLVGETALLCYPIIGQQVAQKTRGASAWAFRYAKEDRERRAKRETIEALEAAAPQEVLGASTRTGTRGQRPSVGQARVIEG